MEERSDETLTTQLARIAERQRAMQADIADLKEFIKALGEHYVTHAEFWPVRSLVYGFAAIILTAVAGALIALIVRGGGL